MPVALVKRINKNMKRHETFTNTWASIFTTWPMTLFLQSSGCIPSKEDSGICLLVNWPLPADIEYLRKKYRTLLVQVLKLLSGCDKFETSQSWSRPFNSQMVRNDVFKCSVPFSVSSHSSCRIPTRHAKTLMWTTKVQLCNSISGNDFERFWKEELRWKPVGLSIRLQRAPSVPQRPTLHRWKPPSPRYKMLRKQSA